MSLFGLHDYVDDPESYYIGIQLAAADTTAGLTGLRVTYPEAAKGEFMGEAVLVHEGRETIQVAGVVPDLEPGEHAVDLVLTAQACDDKICLAPAQVPVHLVLDVE